MISDIIIANSIFFLFLINDKLFDPKILDQKKAVFIFLWAIFIPSLIVGYLSLSTF